MRDYQKDLEICEKATDGPWKVDYEDFEERDYHPAKYGPVGIKGGDKYPIVDCNGWGWDEGRGLSECSHNAEFIATAREALPYYIKRCMELEEFRGTIHKRYAFLADDSVVTNEMLDIKKANARITQLEELLVDIEKRCDWIDRDRTERDKVMLGTDGIRFVIAMVYPKCERGGDTPCTTSQE